MTDKTIFLGKGTYFYRAFVLKRDKCGEWWARISDCNYLRARSKQELIALIDDWFREGEQ